jgi:hypothetical protein
MKNETQKTTINGSLSDASACSILHLTLHKKWFDMIQSGVKREEYRERKPFWDKRLSKQYDRIKFVNGYGNHRPWMIVELVGHHTGFGRSGWGAPESDTVHVLSLGKILSPNDQSEPLHG